MKRLLPLMLMMVGVLCMSFQCEPDPEPIVNRGEWRVKNGTGQKLWIKPTNQDHGQRELGVGEEFTLTTHRYPIRLMPEFGSMLEHWRGWAQENIYFSVLSATGTPLREWLYTDAPSVPDSFFNERAWTGTVTDGERDDEIDATWLFTIEPRHIAPAAVQNGGGAGALQNIERAYVTRETGIVPVGGEEVRP